jgi:hypothetical protein
MTMMIFSSEGVGCGWMDGWMDGVEVEVGEKTSWSD